MAVTDPRVARFSLTDDTTNTDDTVGAIPDRMSPLPTPVVAWMTALGIHHVVTSDVRAHVTVTDHRSSGLTSADTRDPLPIARDRSG